MVDRTANTLWMGDLEPYMDEAFISNAFHSMGEGVISVKVIKNKHTGMPTGYCFVEFPDQEAAHRAMLSLNGKIVPGSMPYKRFKLNHASFGREHLNVPEYSLFVGDLTEDVDDLILYSHFHTHYKNLRGAKVVVDENGKSRGYGFVRFTCEKDQQKALVEMQHYTGIGRKPIRVSLATPKKTQAGMTGGTYTASTSAGYDYYGQGYNQGYYNNWWQAYQQPGYGYDPYMQHDSYAQGDTEGYEVGEVLVDPEVHVDVKKLNHEFIQQSEEFYDAMESSRWFPIDNASMTVSEVM